MKPNGKMQNRCEARRGTIEEITQAVNSRDIPKALHAVQDAWSPSHGYQEWNGGGVWGWPGAFHLLGDRFPGDDAKQRATASSQRLLRDYRTGGTQSFLLRNEYAPTMFQRGRYL